MILPANHASPVPAGTETSPDPVRDRPRRAAGRLVADDLVRGTYHLRLDVRQPNDFSRFVIFQVGADTYSYTSEQKLAVGNATGLIREWPAQWGGGRYRTAPHECTGRVPWQARLGGRPARPWVREYGVNARGADTSTLDVLPPPDVVRLLPGD